MADAADSGGEDSVGDDSGGDDSGGDDTGAEDSGDTSDSGDDTGDTGHTATPAERLSGTVELPAGTGLLGENTEDYAGAVLETRGDLNGDGWTDIAIGAEGYHGEASGGGAAYVVFGPVDAELNLGDADLSVRGDIASAFLGTSLAFVAGSAGQDDLLIGAWNEDAGRVCLVEGGSTGSSLLTEQETCWVGEAKGDSAGRSAASGDLDGDGASDVIIGAPGTSNFSADGGAVYVEFGSGHSGGGLGGADVRIYGDTANLGFGESIADGADLDGDGVDDLVATGFGYEGGARNSGAAFLFAGPPSSGVASDADAIVYGHGSNNQVGGSPRSVSLDSDIDGDGRADLLVGAYGNAMDSSSEHANSGAAYVVTGDAVDGKLDLSFATATITGAAPQDVAGWSVEGVGDLDGDSYGDILIGAPGADPSGERSGAAYVLYGPLSGASSVVDAAATIEGAGSTWEIGFSLGGGVDLSGDGVPDLLVGGEGADGGATKSGAVFLIPG